MKIKKTKKTKKDYLFKSFYFHNIMEVPIDTAVYENIIFEHHNHKELILYGLDLVREFIKRKKLILTGGMAIDFALKLQGDKLYGDDQLPDYDFYSPNHAADAYELMDQLCRDPKFAGFKLDVIGATHTTSMRVRVDYTNVLADITYIPKNIYEEIPTLTYEGVRFEHPHYKIINIHRALHLPFEHIHQPVIFHRWKKDIKRFNMLWKYYPIVLEEKNKEKIKLFEVEVPEHILENQCLAGFSVLALLDKKIKYNEKTKTFHINQLDDRIVILSTKPADLVKLIHTELKKKTEVIEYNQVLDQLGKRYTIGQYDIYDHSDRYTSAYIGKEISEYLELKEPISSRIFIANPQFEMMRSLLFYHIRSISQIPKEILLFNYTSIFAHIESNPFSHPSVEVYDHQEKQITQSEVLLARKQTLMQHGLIERTILKPKNKRECDDQTTTFDYSSEFFQTDGLQITAKTK